MNNFKLVQDSKVPIEEVRINIVGLKWLAGFHPKFNTLLKHEDVEAKAIFDLRPYFCSGGYLEEEPLLYGLLPFALIVVSNALHA